MFSAVDSYSYSSEPEACGHRHAPHAARPGDLPESEGIHYRIDSREMHAIENIIRGYTQIERSRFFDGDRLVERHVQGDLSWALDNVSSRVTEARSSWIHTRSAWYAKRRGIEPLKRGWIANRNGLSGDSIGAQ